MAMQGTQKKKEKKKKEGRRKKKKTPIKEDRNKRSQKTSVTTKYISEKHSCIYNRHTNIFICMYRDHQSEHI
jgi:hypothetical protein